MIIPLYDLEVFDFFPLFFTFCKLQVVCYGELGCFRDEGPFNYLDMLPSPPEEIGTVFYLYTRHNRELPQAARTHIERWR